MNYRWVAAILGLLLVSAAVYAYLTFHQPEPTLPDPYASACGPRPADVGVSAKEIELAGVNIGQLALGKIHASSKPEILSALTASSKNSLVVDYLICVAVQRGDVEKDNIEQRNYIRSLFIFFQTGPTAQQMDQWQADHPFPKRVGKLETPDLEGPLRVLNFEKEPYKKIRLINSGDDVLSVWFSHFPGDVFFSNVGLGPWQISPGNTQELTIVYMHVSTSSNEFPFQIQDGAGLNVDARIHINPDTTLSYGDMKSSVKQLALVPSVGNPNPQIWQVPADTLYAVTSSVIQERFPTIDAVTKDLLAANVLTSLNSTDGAKIAAASAASKSFELRSSTFYKLYLNQLGVPVAPQ